MSEIVASCTSAKTYSAGGRRIDMLRLTSNTAQTEVGRCGLSGGNIEIGEGGANFPQGSSPQTTLLVCEEWGVAKRPQKIVYWRHKQEKCQFQPEFQTRLRADIG